LVSIFVNCSNPIEKKKKEFENCNIYFVKAEILKYNLVLLPPIPKIYFKVMLELENNNDTEVLVEKFHFDLYSNFSNTENVILARIDHSNEIIVLPNSIQPIELDLVTSLEENPDSKIYKLVLTIIKSAFNQKQLDFKLIGTIYYKSIIGNIELPFSKIIRVNMNPKL
jgi:hypothetical protein